MPPTEVRAFRDDDGNVPLSEWLHNLEQTEPKAHAKCLARILELAERGNEMRRPHADYLRDGIYELRAPWKKKQYRILYFFFGKHAVVLSHDITKTDIVPPDDIEAAVDHSNLVRTSARKYTADIEV
ncbi:MAG: type II toxin-antitoxin system RelE/ParE family toxin [Planctomycetes bacterium]|nr:type II toxin-antitoxin system RelE/ParE family toxin [Planctomycetota bacterium]